MVDHSKIFLIGFMGSGKTTLGKELAKKKGFEFIDLDEFIELQEGESIEEIFNNRGEDCFRLIEQQALKKVINSSKKFILALGGGTPCFFDNINLVNDAGTSVYLKYNSSVLVKRLMNAKVIRPLIKGKSESELIKYIEDRLLIREEFYNKSDYIINSDNIKVLDVEALFNNV